MTLPPERKRTGPAPSLPDRKPLTIHLAGEMMDALREAARKQGVGIGEYARRLIGKGLERSVSANAPSAPHGTDGE